MQKPLANSPDELDRLLGRFLSRFARVTSDNIETFAESCCNYLGLHEFPRDPVRYLPAIGITVEPANLGRGVRAVWLKTPGGVYIRYSRYAAGKVGLVLWHEFFEILSAHTRFPTRLSVEAEERLATLFGVFLMMPEKEVRRQASQLGHPEVLDKSRVLSSRFGVSYTAMKLRLKELNLVSPARPAGSARALRPERPV